MDWKVRPHRNPGELDVHSIASMSYNDRDVLMPYTMSLTTIRGYRDQFLVAEAPETFGRLETEDVLPILGGAVHFVPSKELQVGVRERADRVLCFLYYVKQVPMDIINQFSGSGNSVMIGQVICPGKGSFYAILEEAKKQFEEIWCWMSINGPSYKSYIRYGFNLNMDDVREFWNVYKCGYSKFVLGIWRKE